MGFILLKTACKGAQIRSLDLIKKRTESNLTIYIKENHGKFGIGRGFSGTSMKFPTNLKKWIKQSLVTFILWYM